jgi:hypothetical protein
MRAWWLLIFLPVVSLAQSSRPYPRAQTPVSDVRQLDFSNRAYPGSLFDSRCAVKRLGTVRMSNGKNAAGNCQLFAIRNAIGELTDDSNQVAMIEVGCNCGEIGINREAIYSSYYFYQVRGGQLRLLGKAPSLAEKVNDYKRFYEMSIDEELDSLVPTMERGLLTYRVVVRSGPEHNPDSHFGARLQYRWDGTRFVLAQSPERWRCVDFDCEPHR